MTTSPAIALAQEVVSGLLRRGVRDAVLAPGSRSGPLALGLVAAEAQGRLRLHVRIDEREAAFLALGLAKGSERPVPVVTTSGTAVTNLHPALLEAWHTGVEVIAVTADRPARLRGTGANQTTDQRGLLAPVVTVDRLDDVTPGGPGHLNLEFDEPLIAEQEWTFATADADVEPTVSPAVRPSREQGHEVPTVVIAGDNSPSEVAELAALAGWPILAEPSSGLRHAPTAVAAGRLLLGIDRLASRIERVVSVGHSTLSRSVTRVLSQSDLDIYHVGDARSFPAVAGQNVRFIDVQDLDDLAGSPPSWAPQWIALDEKIEPRLPADPALTLARRVWQAAVPDGLLVLGPSQVMRDIDLMAPARVTAPTVLANRGLAGIDGMLSTAIGAALTHGGPSFAYVGDVTFLHGSNGLLIGAREPRPELTIVVLNDDGGSIFATLEQGAPEHADVFERVYATPTGASIEDLCRAARVQHTLTTVEHFEDAVAAGGSGVRVIEVRLPRLGRRALAEQLGRLSEQM